MVSPFPLGFALSAKQVLMKYSKKYTCRYNGTTPAKFQIGDPRILKQFIAALAEKFSFSFDSLSESLMISDSRSSIPIDDLTLCRNCSSRLTFSYTSLWKLNPNSRVKGIIPMQTCLKSEATVGMGIPKVLKINTEPEAESPEKPDPALYPRTNLPGKHFMKPRMVAVLTLVELPIRLPEAKTKIIPVSLARLYPTPNPMNPTMVAAQSTYNFFTCDTCRKYSELIHRTKEENNSKDLLQDYLHGETTDQVLSVEVVSQVLSVTEDHVGAEETYHAE